jgi:hypothetical protein
MPPRADPGLQGMLHAAKGVLCLADHGQSASPIEKGVTRCAISMGGGVFLGPSKSTGRN